MKTETPATVTVPYGDLLTLQAQLRDILAGFTRDDAANYDDTNPEDTYYNVAWALECLDDTLNTYTPANADDTPPHGTPRPWHVWSATATDGVGREPIATLPTRADADEWADSEWSPNLPNSATYIIARTYRTAAKIARDLYGN